MLRNLNRLPAKRYFTLSAFLLVGSILTVAVLTDNIFLSMVSIVLSQVILWMDRKHKLSTMKQVSYITAHEMQQINTLPEYEIIDLQFPVYHETDTLQKTNTTYWMKNYPLN